MTTYCTGAVVLAGGAAFWLAHTGVVLHCARSDASALRHAAPGPPPPTAPSAGGEDGGEVGDGSLGSDGPGGPEVGEVGSASPLPADGPDRDGLPDGGGDALGGVEVAAGVDGGGEAGVPEAGPAAAASEAAEVSDPDGPRAAELVPPSQAAARSASTARRAAPTSGRRRRPWRLPRVAIDSIPVLTAPCVAHDERAADDQ
jgi:hypothetical protein